MGKLWHEQGCNWRIQEHQTHKEKRLLSQPFPHGIKSRLCRCAGILNLTVQVGCSWFNFGFIGLATLSPIERIPQPMLVNGSRNIWQSRTRQEYEVYSNSRRRSKHYR